MFTALTLSLALCVPGADAWPGFLGAGASPLAPDSLPLTWSPTEHIAWGTETPGHGQSSPVIWGQQVFVTAIEGPEKETCHVVALRLDDGTIAWKHSFEATQKAKNTLYVSRAAPTPATDGERLYVFFESGDVAALSLDGKPLWRSALTKDYGPFVNKFGLSASPLLTDNAVIVLVDDEGPSYLVALDKADGKTLWKTERSSRVSWSSPALVPMAEGEQIVVSSAGSVDGYDPATGAKLWSFDEVGGNTACTPMPYAPGKFLIGASAGRDSADRAEQAKQSNLALSIAKVDGQPQPKVLWRNEQATPSFGSPMVHAGHAYWVNRQGVVYCLDVETGAARYVQRTKQSVWATPLGLGDRVYLFGKDGLTTVIAAGPKFEVLAENQLWDPATLKPDPARAASEDTAERKAGAASFSGATQYGIAAVNGSLVIRTGDKLYCLRK
jgi:outer membrane protein assembly factor BamB